MIIEMMGLPGAGKTFLGNAFAEYMLNKKGIPTVNMIEKRRTVFTYKVAGKFFETFLTVYPPAIKLQKQITEILRDYTQKKAHYNTCYIDVYIRKLVQYVFLYRWIENKSQIYLFDEGIVQQLVNISVNFEIGSTEQKKMIALIEWDRFRLTYVDIDIEKAIQSIEARNRHICFIDELKGDELVHFLEEYQAMCELFFDRINGLKVKREQDMTDNLELMYASLKEE